MGFVGANGVGVSLELDWIGLDWLRFVLQSALWMVFGWIWLGIWGWLQPRIGLAPA